MENSPLSSLPLVVTSVLEEIQSSSNRVDTIRGRTHERLEQLLQMIHVSINFIKYKMIGLSILGALNFLNVLIQHLPLQSMS